MTPDLSNVPTADLRAIAAGNMGAVSTPTLRYLSGQPQQPVAMAPPVNAPAIAAETVGKELWGAAGTAANAVANLPHAAVAAIDNALQHAGGVEHPQPTSALAVTNTTPEMQEFQQSVERSPLVQNPVSQWVGNKVSELEQAHPQATDLAKDAAALLPALGATRLVEGGLDAAAASRAARAEAQPDWFKAGFRNAEDHPIARNVAAGSGRDALTLRNQEVGNTILANEAGVTLPAQNGGDVEGAFAAGREAPNSVYNRAALTVEPHTLADDPTLAQAIQNAGMDGRITAGTPQSAAAIQSLQSQLLDPERVVSGNELVNELRGLRQEGYRNVGSEDVSNQHLGSAQLDMANALEAHLGAALPRGGPVSLEQLQQARTALAKNYAVQGAMRGRNVDLAAIGRMGRADPGLLTGGMKLASDFANDNPAVIGLGSKIYQPPSYTEDLMGLRGTHNPETFLSPSWWAGAGGFKALARRILAGPAGEGAAQAGEAFPPRGDEPFAPIPGLTPPPGTVGRMPPIQGTFGDLPQGPGGGPPFSTAPMGAPPSPAAAGGGIPLADVLGQGVEQEPPAGLSSGPMGSPAQGGMPFAVPPESLAGDLELAPETPGAAQSRYGDLADVMSQGVPENMLMRTAPPGGQPGLIDLLNGDTGAQGAPPGALPPGKPWSGMLLRGTPAGVDPQALNSAGARFLTPSLEKATQYARGGEITAHPVRAGYMLDVGDPGATAHTLGLGPGADMMQIAHSARNAGYDMVRVMVDGEPEYIHIPENGAQPPGLGEELGGP